MPHVVVVEEAHVGALGVEVARLRGREVAVGAAGEVEGARDGAHDEGGEGEEGAGGEEAGDATVADLDRVPAEETLKIIHLGYTSL